jgi:hypothetical protein
MTVPELVIQPNGKIVLAGSTCDLSDQNCDFALARQPVARWMRPSAGMAS